MFYVICRDDAYPDGTKGKYVLATSRSFETYAAAFDYSKGVAQAREPIILTEAGVEKMAYESYTDIDDIELDCRKRVLSLVWKDNNDRAEVYAANALFKTPIKDGSVATWISGWKNKQQ